MPNGWQEAGDWRVVELIAVGNRWRRFFVGEGKNGWNFRGGSSVTRANPSELLKGGEAMKKKTVILLVVLALGLAACGAAAPMMLDERVVAPSYYDGSDVGGGAPEVVNEGLAPVPTAVYYDPYKVDTGNTEPGQERMVIMNADLTIVIPDPQAKMDEIAALADSLGGFVVSLNMYQTYLYDGGTAPEGYISIRVPADKLENALSQIKADVVEVRNETRNGQDVTADYVDLQSRLTALEAARDQLQTIMDAATKTEDVLNVFNQLQYYNEQIEMVKGQMKYYEEASAYSLINVTLVAEETLQPIQIGPWTPNEAARDAIQALIRFLQGFVDFLLYFFLLVVPILIVVFGPVALVAWLIVRGLKRRKSKKTAAAK
jgi:hypothetical protein